MYKEEINKTREGQAYNALSEAMNSFSFRPEVFAEAVCYDHRTLQQTMFRTIVAVIKKMASDDYGYDDRNRMAHERCKAIVDSGLIDGYVPMI